MPRVKKAQEIAEVVDEKKPYGIDASAYRHPVAHFSDAAMHLERLRVASQVKLAHHARRGEDDPDTRVLLEEKLIPAEDYADRQLQKWVFEHPTAKWWQRINGILPEVVGKIVGSIDNFGKFYLLGDPMIPVHIQREPETDKREKKWVWVEGIERLMTPSKFWKLSGLMPNSKYGDHNGELKTLLFRQMYFGFILQSGRKEIKYYKFYIDWKNWKKQKLISEGIEIKPTPRGRYCATCQKNVEVKAAKFCPECANPLEKKIEPDGVIFEGHLDFMARRKTMKLFGAHLITVYREAKKLSVRPPYPVEHLGHSTTISPWDMVDL